MPLFPKRRFTPRHVALASLTSLPYKYPSFSPHPTLTFTVVTFLCFLFWLSFCLPPTAHSQLRPLPLPTRKCLPSLSLPDHPSMASQDNSPSYHTSSSSPSSGSPEPQHSPSSSQNPAPDRQGVTDHPDTSTSAIVAAVPLQSVAAHTTVDHRRFSSIVEILPAPPAVTSKMSEADYSFAQYLMGPSAKIKRAGDRAITDPPSSKYIGMHLQSARYGFRVPTTPLMASICTFYRIVLGMLSPNSHQLITCLQSLCQFAGIKVDLEIFHQLFQVTKIGNKSPGYLNAS